MPHYTSIQDFEENAAPKEAETALIAACRRDGEHIISETRPESDTTENTIRADLLRLLITGGTKDCALHPSGLWLEGAWITGTLDLRFAQACGQTALKACHFTERPRFTQTRFHQLSLDGSALPGLFAQGMIVTGSVFLRNLTATDTVDVNSAVIGGQLSCKGATLDGKGQKALQAQSVKVTQHLVLINITATETVDVAGAEIGGHLDCTGATLDGKGQRALNCQSMKVAAFFWRYLKSVQGAVDLTSAHIGDLVDDIASWPNGADAVVLNGLTYDRISGGSNTSAKDRLIWLATGARFKGTLRPQPYTHLAKVLSGMGHDRDARLVLTERERLLAIEARKARAVEPNGDVDVAFKSVWYDIVNGLSWLWDLLLRHIIGYGYAPFRSLWTLLVLISVAWVLAALCWTEGSFAPNSDIIILSPGWTDLISTDCTHNPSKTPPVCLRNPAEAWSANNHQGMDWESFNPPAYAVDLVIPVLSLGQTDAWAPSSGRGPWGWALWWGRWWLIASGWIVSALGAAAVTGIVKQDRE